MPVSTYIAALGNEANKLRGRLPSLGWTESFAVPKDLIGATIVFIGSEEDKAELVLDYCTPKGEEKRLVMAFSERGMWPKSSCQNPISA